jgi:nucleotide-binding universal stress UspA family protein
MSDSPPQGTGLVLAAVDFSKASSVGLAWAAGLARARSWQLHLVHAVAQLTPPPHTFELSDRVLEAVQEAAAHKLQGVAEKVEGLEVGTTVRFGASSEVIMEVAAELGAEVVVVATRGRRGFRHLLLGSTARRVVHGCTRPVLSVHPGDVSLPRPPATILLPTDFSRDAAAAARAAVELFQVRESGARLILFHAFRYDSAYAVYGPASARRLTERREEVAVYWQEQVEREAATLRDLGLEVEAEAREGYPPEAILAAARRHSVELVAMGARGSSDLRHALLGSTSERIVQYAACPVLTVPGPPAGE